MERKKLLFAGASGAGKSTLCRVLLDLEGPVRKTQSAEFHRGAAVDLPGEFLTHPRLRTAFLASAQEAAVILYVQAADAEPLPVPADLLRIAPGATVIGVINKIDAPGANPSRAAAHLRELGIREPYFALSALRPETTAELRAELRRRGVIPHPAANGDSA